MQATIFIEKSENTCDCAHAIGQLWSRDSCMIKDVAIESALFVVNRQWGKFVCALTIKERTCRLPGQLVCTCVMCSVNRICDEVWPGNQHMRFAIAEDNGLCQ